MARIRYGNVDGEYAKNVPPSSLLEACLFVDGKQGGTIHEYLHRLQWFYCGMTKAGPYWVLALQGNWSTWSSNRYYPGDYTPIGHMYGEKKYLPKIEPGIDKNYLDFIWTN